MMYAHLLVAGPLEALVTGLAVRYLIRTGHALHGEETETAAASVHPGPASAGTVRPEPGGLPRWAWRGVVTTILAAPLGLLASGTAWGEWGPEELSARLGYVPAGLARWAARWGGFLPD